MMQSMGWNGGPLGIRGEGITEPIMPHLNHKSGAGLGHVPAKKNTPTTRSTAKTQLKTQETQPPDVASNGHELTNLSYTMQNSNVEFRAKVLTALLDLVEKRSEIYIMRFQEVLSSEEMSFIMSFVCALNKRTRVAFTTREEAILNHQLLSCMKQSKDLSITCSFDNNNKRVTFVRVKPKANKWTKPPHTKASRCLSPSCVVIQRGKDGSWPDTMPSAAGLPRSQKKMNFRIFLLVNMLELLNAANIRQKTLYFNCSRKKKTFAREAATILNDGNKSLRSIITVYENDLVMDISEFYGQVSIDFEFIQAHKKCIMKKIFKKNVNNNSVKSDKACHSERRLTDETATSMNSSNSESNPETNCSSVCSETLSQNSLQDSYHSPKVLFRIGVFKSFLELMENDAQELVVSYKKRLTHKEISFIHHIINTLNKRVRMALNIAEEIRLESKLSGLMRNNRGLMIHGSVNGDKKELAIKKWAIINPREKETPETTLNPKQVYISKNPDGTWPTTFQPPHEVNESVNSFNYRVFMLVNVLEFLKNKQEDTRELSFVEQVCEEYYEYAKSLVAMVNNKQNCLHHGTDFEKSIMCDISEFYQDINLNLVFHESSRKFILMKVCLKKDNIKTENVPINNTSECINIEVIDNDDLKSNTDDSTDKHLVSTLEYDKMLKSDDQTSLEIVKEKIDKKYVITNKIIHDTNKNSMESETASFTKKSHKDLENVFYDNDDVFTDESNCNTEIKNENDAIVNHLSSSSKRSRSDSAESMPDNSKKTKILYFENSQKLSIVPKDYPRKIMTKEYLIELQNIISESIDKEDELPLLQCHGIQDGVLVYACHNERSLFFLENTLNLAGDFKIIDNNTEEDECYNMKIKINTLCQNLSKIFNRLESYNAGLNTDNWCVTDIKTNIDNIIISVDIDKESYDYVCFNNFCLYVGIDIARFSVVWD
ncbi:uncharacterized protein LOC113514004 isoform X2 [Galleria mellonella]|nr:uncharacterized protein LOC113514004 isoform X2 [Galleria mellonella]